MAAPGRVEMFILPEHLLSSDSFFLFYSWSFVIIILTFYSYGYSTNCNAVVMVWFRYRGNGCENGGFWQLTCSGEHKVNPIWRESPPYYYAVVVVSETRQSITEILGTHTLLNRIAYYHTHNQMVKKIAAILSLQVLISLRMVSV